MGGWPITFPGFADPPYGDGWHVEGNWFHHHLWSPKQAVVNLFCFSTVEPGGGGTLIVEGDVVLAHPLVFHSANPNHGSWPRVMAQTAFSMTEPKRTEGDALFPVEVPLSRAVAATA